MGQPSLQDFQAPFDPTAFPQITQAELLQLVTGAAPLNGQNGLVFTTTDVAGVPQVPDANTNAKWQYYLWKRVGAASVTAYVWNPTAASDPTYLKWQSITLSSIPDGAVTNGKIATNAVTDDKIAAVSYGKLTGVPTSFTPGGAAGGDLAGTYPNPTIGANVVDSTKLKSDATVDANRAVTTNHIRNNAIDLASKILMTGAAAKQLVRVKDDASGLMFETHLITQLAEPSVPTELNYIRVKNDASGYEFRTPAQVGNDTSQARMFTSAEIALAANNVASSAHGLGAIPTFVRWVLRCKTGDLGYSVGDEVEVSTAMNNALSATNYGPGADAANVTCIQLDINPQIHKKSATIGTFGAVTSANWKLVCYAKL